MKFKILSFDYDDENYIHRGDAADLKAAVTKARRLAKAENGFTIITQGRVVVWDSSSGFEQ